MQGFEDKEWIKLPFCDLIKAFGNTSHDLLLETVDYYGILGLPIKIVG